MGFLYIVGFLGVCVAIAMVVVRFLDWLDARKQQALKAGYLPPIVLLCNGEAFPECPHVVIPIDSPAVYCQHCGAVMKNQLARLSGYDTETGLPQYRLVRACPKVRFHRLCGCIWDSGLHRHTVQGPTDTRLVLGGVLLVFAAILIAVAVSNIGTEPPRSPYSYSPHLGK